MQQENKPKPCNHTWYLVCFNLDQAGNSFELVGDGEDSAQAVLDGAAAAGSVTTGILADKLDLIEELKAEGVVVFCCSILNSLVLFRSLKLSYIWSLIADRTLGSQRQVDSVASPPAPPPPPPPTPS